MSNDKDKDKDKDGLGDLLSDELGEWDAMFDSLHEGDEEEAPPAAAATPEPVPEHVDPSSNEAVPGFISPTTPSGSFDVASTVSGTPFEGAPESGTSVDMLAPDAEEASSPFSSEGEDDFGSLLGNEPEALGGLLGSGPIGRPVEPSRPTGKRLPTAAEVRADQEAVFRAAPMGPDDAAFDDFEESTSIVSSAQMASMAKSAAAFFEEESEASNEVSLELDDDFYDGIQIGDQAAPSSAPAEPAAQEPERQRAASESSGKRTFAKVVRRDSAVPVAIDREISAAAAIAAVDSVLADEAESSFDGPIISNQAAGNETVVAMAPSDDALAEADASFNEGTLASLPTIETISDDELPDIPVPDPVSEELPAEDADSLPTAPPAVEEAALAPPLEEVAALPELEDSADAPLFLGEAAALPVLEDAPALAEEAAALPDLEDPEVYLEEPPTRPLVEDAVDVPPVEDLNSLDDATQMAAIPDAVPQPIAEAVPEPVPVPEPAPEPVPDPEPEADSDDSGSLDEVLDQAFGGYDEPFPAPRPDAVEAAPVPDLAERQFGGDDLAGVVEAAVEDAVAMSTGTLLTGPRFEDPDVEPDLPPEKFTRTVPGPDLGSISVPEDVGLDALDRTEEFAKLLVLYDRELELLDEVDTTMRLRMEAGRIAESLGDLEQARLHFDEALKFDPHLVPANRALRRIERVLGNWEEVIRLLGKELANSSAAEADALTLNRISLLMAVGELDMARVTVGELLDESPNDARALLANLDLAFMDGRDDEVASTLDSLSEVLTEPSLIVAVLNFAGALAEQGGRDEAAIALLTRASQMQPSLGSALALRGAALKNKSSDLALLALEQARACAHPPLRAGLDWQRSELHLAASEIQEAHDLLVEALQAAPDDLLLAQQLVRTLPAESASAALQELAGKTDVGPWSSQLQARAARMSTLEEALPLYQQSAATSGGSAFSNAELRQSLVEAGQWQECYQLDRSTHVPGDILGPYQAAQAAVHAGLPLDALALVSSARATQESGSQPLELSFLELAYCVNDQSALSEYEAADASSASGESAERLRSRALTRQAIANVAEPDLLAEASNAWATLAENATSGEEAADTALLVASISKNPDLLLPRLELAEQGTKNEARAVQAAVESAGIALASEPEASAERIFALQASRPSRRGALLQWAFSLASGDLAGAAACFESEAQRVVESDSAGADRCLYRASFLRVQEDISPALASDALEQITERRADFAAATSLRNSLDSQSGSSGSTASEQRAADGAPVVAQDNLSLDIRRAEAMSHAGDHAAATELLTAVLESNPDDALVAYAFHRACWEAPASALLAERALAAMREAEAKDDSVAKARASEELALIDGELRGDYSSALMFWESASTSDTSRADLLRTLQRELGNLGVERLESDTAWKALGRHIDTLEAGTERSAYLLERARVGIALGHPESEILSDYTQAFEENTQCREALFFLESRTSQDGASELLASLEVKVSDYFATDARARAAFLVRAGETLRGLDQPELAMSRFKMASEVMPGFAPALFAWRDMALDHEMWESLAEACLLEAESVDSDRGRADLYHLAGVTLMDKAEEEERAMDALRRVLAVDALHRDAFVRLRVLFEKSDMPDDLAQLLSMRIEVETEPAHLCELHHARAVVMRGPLENLPEALAHLRAVLALRPSDKGAMVGVSEIAWELEQWAEAAEALMVLARVETETPELISVFSRLGTIYSDHMPEPAWALKSFRKVIGLDSSNIYALGKFAELAAESGDHKLALGAYEQLIKQDPPIAEKVGYLHKMANSFLEGFGDTNKAERALRVALDLDFSNEEAFDALIGFYLSQNNQRSARVHMDLVANSMRQRLRKDPTDAAAYHVIAHAMEARTKAGVKESKVVARAAANMAILLGDSSQSMKALVASTKYTPRYRGLASKEHDDLLYPAEARSGVRALLDLLGERLAKHVGVDVRSHGVGRSDRLRDGGDPIGQIVQEIAAAMELDSPEVYISSQSSQVLAAEPTKPASLIFGGELVSADRAGELRFFTGRLIKMVSASLSTPLGLGEEKFGILLVGLLRQFQAEFVPKSMDEDALAAEQQRLRRLIPSGMLQELAPFALGLATSDFDHTAIWQGLVDAGNRTGLLCAGDIPAAVHALMRYKGISDIHEALQDAEIANLARFACSEDHVSIYAAIS